MSQLTTPEQIQLEPATQASALKQVRAGKTTVLQYQVQVFTRMDAALAQTGGIPGRTLACKPGCGLCCHYHVNIAPSEALALAEHVETNFSEAQKVAVKRRLKENADLAATLGPDKHIYTNIACAFLTEGQQCGVYEVRPAACRRHHSYDIEPCRVTFDNPTAPDEGVPQSEAWIKVAELFILSGHKAQQTEGFDVQRYELNAAVWEALNNRASLKRWRDGKVSFPTVKDRSDLI